LFCCALKEREKHFDHQSVTDMVGSKLDLVTILGQAGWEGHDSSIGVEDIQTVGFGEELVGSLLDGAQVGQITSNESDWNTRTLFVDLGDQFVGLSTISATEEDVCGFLLCKQGDTSSTKPSSSYLC
jgi:hypothetical protein